MREFFHNAGRLLIAALVVVVFGLLALAHGGASSTVAVSLATGLALVVAFVAARFWFGLRRSLNRRP